LKNEVAQYYINRDIISIDSIQNLGNEDLMEKILKEVHKYKISKGKDGRWSTYVPDSTKANGIRNVKKKTKQELYDYLVGFYALEEKRITFEEVFNEWIAYLEQFTNVRNRSKAKSPSTITRYKRDYKNYLSTVPFSKKPIRFLNPKTLNSDLLDLIKDKDLKEKFAKNLISNVNGVLKYAYMNGYTDEDIQRYIDKDSLLAACVGDSYKTSKRVLNPEEWDKLLCFIKESEKKRPEYAPNYAMELAFYTGLRVGEIVALHWGDIDFKNDIIHVSYSEHKIDLENSHYYEIGEPKNEKHRAVPLTKSAKSCLYRVKQLGRTNSEDFVFINELGTRVLTYHVSNALARRGRSCFGKDFGNVSMHEIRRTVSSRCNMVGARNQTALMLGHSERVNAQYYTYDTGSYSEQRKMLELSENVGKRIS